MAEKENMEKGEHRNKSGVELISDMRIVLLGCEDAGKSSSGNAILGRQAFDVSEKAASACVKKEGNTGGRHITVVEALGWCWNFTVEKTPEHVKQTIVHSVSLCPPGPHALLLTIDVTESFTEEHRRAVQEHLELLGEKVWSHTIVLFTFANLINKPIEQHIESEGGALQWVLEKCGNRYHVLNDNSQVIKLLYKIEKMVAGNSGHHFHFDENELKKQLEKRKDEERRAVEMVVADSGTFQEPPRPQAQKEVNVPRVEDSGFSSDSSLASESQYSTCQRSPLLSKENTYIGFKIPFVNAETIQRKTFIKGGSFGKVYRGSYQGTPVAVKKLHIGEYPYDSLELIIPLRLSHPHIVKMMAVSSEKHNLLIAYEYIHGANLDEVIYKQCPIELNEEGKMGVALDMAMAVEYIHGISVIHQDIKPANILVSERSKKAYLTDWGLANMKDSLAQFGVAASGSLCGPRSAGTPLYKAPELLKNERCTTMSDMWSLGLTYLEMFTGSWPWNLNNDFALMGALYNQERPHALAKLQPHLTKIVEPLVQYKPQSRMTATDLVKCLKTKVDLEKRYGYPF